MFTPPPYQALKRVVDLVLALVLTVLTAPLLLLAVFLVKVTSQGPAIYSQVRLGRDRRPFLIYKIRSMYHNCERLTGPAWSTANDPRVTPIGRFLRRSHLDELPQLWNVVRGDMSLIGPRPECPEFVDQLEKTIPRYGERLRVRPGVSGLAEVNLPPDTDQESVRRKLSYDLYYVGQAGVWLDLRLMLATALFLVGVPFAASAKVLGLRPFGDVSATPRRRPSAGFEPVTTGFGASWRDT